jgi:hypothetical protein
MYDNQCIIASGTARSAAAEMVVVAAKTSSVREKSGLDGPAAVIVACVIRMLTNVYEL